MDSVRKYKPLNDQEGLHTLDEVNEHLQVPDLGFKLIYQLFFDPGRIDDLSNGSIYPLPQLLRRQVPNVLIQVHIQLFNQLINDNLKRAIQMVYVRVANAVDEL